jgi:hypothetical protein
MTAPPRKVDTLTISFGGIGHTVITRVRILKGEGEERKARLIDAPMLEEMERPFCLPALKLG